ncbi:MAG: response regulator [Candidatus Paceibacterota bacterium]|jgi:DNA-binding response OmpR family regulator
MKILIIEDEEILGKVLEEKFIEEKFEVELVADGDRALAAAKKFKPDVILLDIILPNVDGLEVLASLKADDDLSIVPVIMLSNLDADEKIKKSLSMGAVDYLVKSQHPVNEVVEKVNEYVIKAK